MRIRSQRWLFVSAVVCVVMGIVAYNFWREFRTPMAGDSVGMKAPQFELISAKGDATDSSVLNGQPYLLTFFASWCFSCQLEHKVLGTVAKGSNISLVGVAYRDTQEAIFNWLSRFGNPFSRIGFDGTGQIGSLWGITGVPETFLVDKDGIIRAHLKGALFSDENIAYLEKAIKSL